PRTARQRRRRLLCFTVKLLLTRPVADAARTATALRARGHEVVMAPLLRVDAVATEFGAGPWDGVVMTSANAASALAKHPRLAERRGLPAFVVGGRTATAAAAIGFSQVSSADGNVDDLVRLLARRPGRRLLYVAGEDQADDLAALLGMAGTAVE